MKIIRIVVNLNNKEYLCKLFDKLDSPIHIYTYQDINVSKCKNEKYVEFSLYVENEDVNYIIRDIKLSLEKICIKEDSVTEPDFICIYRVENFIYIKNSKVSL